APVEGEPVFAAAGITEDGNVTREDSSEALNKGIASIARYAGGTHFINKRVANNRRIGLLHDALPDARFISIVRDGRAVALSLSKVDWWQQSPVWWAGTTPIEWEAGGGDAWQLCAENWVQEVDAIEEGLEAVPDDAQHAVTYEGLVADPIGVLTGIAEAIGLPVDEEWLEEVSTLRLPNQNERWQTELDDHATRVILGEQGPTLLRLGYLSSETR
ncbi:MAG: sulfotransferase, partial [Actinomycetota bacterium]|nr:sulfotransferase [Actinomycetota bacterium]